MVLPAAVEDACPRAGCQFDRITYGSDFPFTREQPVAMFGDMMGDCMKKGWTEENIEKDYANAAKLFGLD